MIDSASALLTDGVWCHLLITAPNDSTVYDCFAQMARRWSHLVTREALWLEHGIPIAPGFRDECKPHCLDNLFATAPLIVSNIELEFAGVLVRYRRSGGHAPFVESFFDEVEIAAGATAPSVTTDDLRQLVDQLVNCLDVKIVSCSPALDAIAAELVGARRSTLGTHMYPAD